MPTDQASPRPDHGRQPVRILLVDDSADDRALAAREIRRDHPEAVFVEAGSQADFEAALAGATTAPFDVAVVDYALGWANGIEAFRRIRAVLPDCGVLVFTGTLGEEHAVEAMKAGLDDYVVKDPRRYPRLRASVTAVLQQHAERRALRRAEADRDVLLKEVFHRVHNNLQTVMSLLRIHAQRAVDSASRRLLEDLGQRVHALALVQGRLYRGEDYRSVDFDAYLRQLGDAHAALGGRAGISVEFALEPLRLPVDVSVPLGLVANELLSNALKHAFPDGREGRIVLALRADPGGGRGTLTVVDDGVGPDPGARAGGTDLGGGERHGGIGAHLVHGLARQIGAEIIVGPRADGSGTEAAVRFPLGRGADQG